MLAYCKNGTVIATHEEGQGVPASAYGAGVVIRRSDVVVSPGDDQPAAAADDVREEAQRRIIALMGARSLNDCLIKQLNAQMRASKLVNKRALGQALTVPETAEAAALEQMATKIEAIRAASNVMEPSPPDDLEDDAHWPA